MQTVDKLLANVPQSEIKSFQSAVHLHLKEMMTLIEKNRLFDTTELKRRKYQCLASCYRANPLNDRETITETIQNIRDCKQRCKDEEEEVLTYLRDVQHYSDQKFHNCSKPCKVKVQNSADRNECLWECYNRLDRRYKRYWKEKRQKIQTKYRLN